MIFLVNAPWYCAAGWKLVKPLIHPNTQKKACRSSKPLQIELPIIIIISYFVSQVKILNAKETLEGLQEHIDLANIPEYYGGKLDFGGPDSCRFHSPEVIALNEFVRDLNERHNVAIRVPAGQTIPPSLAPRAAAESPRPKEAAASKGVADLGQAAKTASATVPATAAAAAGRGGAPPLHPVIQKPTVAAIENNRKLQRQGRFQKYFFVTYTFNIFPWTLLLILVHNLLCYAFAYYDFLSVCIPESHTSTNLHFAHDHRSADEEWSIASNTTINSSARSNGAKAAQRDSNSSGDSSTAGSNAAAVRALSGRSNGYNSFNSSTNVYSHTKPVQVLPGGSPMSSISNSTTGKR